MRMLVMMVTVLEVVWELLEELGVVGMNAGAAQSEFESDVGLSGAISAHFGDSVAVVPW